MTHLIDESQGFANDGTRLTLCGRFVTPDRARIPGQERDEEAVCATCRKRDESYLQARRDSIT